MNIETVAEHEQSVFAPILPPTVAAVKQLAHSKLLLASGIMIFVAFLILSACDFAAGVILLPLGALMLTAHIVAFVKSKVGKGSYGLRFLGAVYLLPLFIESAFTIWEDVLYYEGKPEFFDTLRELTFDLPAFFDAYLNRCVFDTELIFSILTVMFTFTSIISMSLSTARRMNIPTLITPLFFFIVEVAVTAAAFGLEFFDVVSGFLPEFSEYSFEAEVLQYLSLATALLMIAYSVTTCVYTLKVYIKMKRTKNVIQK